MVSPGSKCVTFAVRSPPEIPHGPVLRTSGPYREVGESKSKWALASKGDSTASAPRRETDKNRMREA
jgi:hypothetical protein